MKIVANSIGEEIVIAEKVNEEFGKTLVYFWNEEMYWKQKSEYHLHLIEEIDKTKPIKGSKL